RPGVRAFGEWEDAPPLWDRSGVGAVGPEGVVRPVQPAGAGPADRQARLAAEPTLEEAIGLRCFADRRPWLRAAESGGDGGRVYAAGGAVRAREGDDHEQPAVLQVGEHLQGPDDDGGGDRPPGPPQRDPGAQRAELPPGASPARSATESRGDDPRGLPDTGCRGAGSTA